MLPDHINIILLSATVPNAQEFAEWVGWVLNDLRYVLRTIITTFQTNKEKGHICHLHLQEASPAGALSVCWSRHAQDSRCGRTVLVSRVCAFMDAELLMFETRHRYKDAGEAVKRKQEKEREAAGLPPLQRLGARAAAPQRGQRGGPPARGGHRGGHRGAPAKATFAHRGGGPSRSPHQVDQGLYIHLIGLLRKKALLPVVIFTFSKKKCEQNAGSLTNVDLSSAAERSEIHITIEKAVMRLKGTHPTF